MWVRLPPRAPFLFVIKRGFEALFLPQLKRTGWARIVCSGTALFTSPSKSHCTYALGFLASMLLSGAVSAARQQQPGDVQKAGDDYRAGVAALSASNLDQALKDFQEVVRLTPSAEPGHLMVGFVLARLGRTKEAILELEKAIALKPSDVDAQLNLALAYEQDGAAAKAVPHFEKAEVATRAQGRSLPPSALISYSRALAAIRQWNAAIGKAQEAVTADPQNAELRDEFGSLYAREGDWAKAREQFAEAVRLNPNSAMAHLHMGVALEAQQVSGIE